MKKNFDPLTILNIASDLLVCLSYIHNEKIIHADLKPSNFVWDCFKTNKNNRDIILIDFSCSLFDLGNNQNYHASGNYSFSSVFQNKNKIVLQKDEIESLIYILLYFMDINLPWIEFYDKTDKYKCKKYLELKTNFKIENYLKKDLKIFTMILFNDIKMKTEKDSIDYNFYNRLIMQEINCLKNKNGNEFRFNKEKEIKNIIIDYINNNNSFEFENRLCNDIFIGFPKELVLESLIKYFGIKL